MTVFEMKNQIAQCGCVLHEEPCSRAAYRSCGLLEDGIILANIESRNMLYHNMPMWCAEPAKYAHLDFSMRDMAEVEREFLIARSNINNDAPRRADLVSARKRRT